MSITNYIPDKLDEKWSVLEKILKIRQTKGYKIGLVWKSKPTPYVFRLALAINSPWYPNMTPCRQSTMGDWSGVIEAMKIALAKIID